MTRTHQRVFNSVVGFVATVIVLLSGWIDDPSAVTMCMLLIVLFGIAFLFSIRDLLRENEANDALFKEAPDES